MDTQQGNSKGDRKLSHRQGNKELLKELKNKMKVNIKKDLNLFYIPAIPVKEKSL